MTESDASFRRHALDADFGIPDATIRSVAQNGRSTAGKSMRRIGNVLQLTGGNRYSLIIMRKNEVRLLMRKRMSREERCSHLRHRLLFAACAALLILLMAFLLSVNATCEFIKPDYGIRAFRRQRDLSTPMESMDPKFCREEASKEAEAALAAVTEDFENEKIQAAMLEKATRIDSCTVTWYTAATCGKKPGDDAYGITYSGLPVVEHLTCAVDKRVIPLYSDVFVQYADGTIEQLWAVDTGVIGNSLDIYTPDYDYAMQCGRQQLTVWFVPPEG